MAGLEAGFCPRCLGTLEPGREVCGGCGLAFTRRGSVLDVLGPRARGAAAARVEAFYTAHPFPGYAAGDDGPGLIDRSRRAPFLVALDRALAPNATLVDVGCGTGQLAAFLALAGPGRRLVAIDGCAESLACADAFRLKARIPNLQLVRADLFDLPVEEQSCDVVLSRGVVHHTPDPDGAIERVARLVAPGGVLVLGFYETWGRAGHAARRALGRVAGRWLRPLDPVLRRRDLGEDKKRVWIADQYEHPLERSLPLPRVLERLEQRGFRWLRSVPPAPSGANLFEASPRPSAVDLAARRAGWLARGLNDPDAGLVVLVLRQARS